MSSEEIEIRPVKGYEGYYSVTSEGVIISNKREIKHLSSTGEEKSFNKKEKVMKPYLSNRGYQVVTLCKEHNKKLITVHKVVADAFLPPPLEGQKVVRHKEGNTSLNGKDDIEWGTQKENCQDSIKHGTTLRGSKNAKTKLTASLVFYVRSQVDLDVPQTDLASELRVTRQNIDAIVKRKTWYYL